MALTRDEFDRAIAALGERFNGSMQLINAKLENQTLQFQSLTDKLNILTQGSIELKQNIQVVKSDISSKIEETASSKKSKSTDASGKVVKENIRNWTGNHCSVSQEQMNKFLEFVKLKDFFEKEIYPKNSSITGSNDPPSKIRKNLFLALWKETGQKNTEISAAAKAYRITIEGASPSTAALTTSPNTANNTVATFVNPASSTPPTTPTNPIVVASPTTNF